MIVQKSRWVQVYNLNPGFDSIKVAEDVAGHLSPAGGGSKGVEWHKWKCQSVGLRYCRDTVPVSLRVSIESRRRLNLTVPEGLYPSLFSTDKTVRFLSTVICGSSSSFQNPTHL